MDTSINKKLLNANYTRNSIERISLLMMRNNAIKIAHLTGIQDRIDDCIFAKMDEAHGDVLHGISEDSFLDLGFDTCTQYSLHEFEDVTSSFLFLDQNTKTFKQTQLKSSEDPQISSEHLTLTEKTFKQTNALEDVQLNGNRSGGLETGGDVCCLPPKKRRALNYYKEGSKSVGGSHSTEAQEEQVGIAQTLKPHPDTNSPISALGIDLMMKEDKIEKHYDQGSCSNNNKTNESGNDGKQPITSEASSPAAPHQEMSKPVQEDKYVNQKSLTEESIGDYQGLIPDISVLHEPGYLLGFRLAMSYLNKEGISAFMKRKRQDRCRILCDLSKCDLRHVEDVQSRILDAINSSIKRELSTNDRIYDKGCYRISRSSDKRIISHLTRLPLIIREEVVMHIGKAPRSRIESDLNGALRESISDCFYDETSF